MTSRERVVRTLEHKPVDRAPRELWTTPHTRMFRKHEMDRLGAAFEWDFAGPEFSYGHSARARGVASVQGSYTDAWGAVWEVAEDGVVGEIKHLIEIWVDAVNSQLFCMNIEDLGRRYNGKVTFWGEIDRQHTLPFGAPADARAAVRRVRKALDRGRGGLIAECSWEKGTPYENVFAVYDEWSKPWDGHC
jgi:hypothetical protein